MSEIDKENMAYFKTLVKDARKIPTRSRIPFRQSVELLLMKYSDDMEVPAIERRKQNQQVIPTKNNERPLVDKEPEVKAVNYEVLSPEQAGSKTTNVIKPEFPVLLNSIKLEGPDSGYNYVSNIYPNQLYVPNPAYGNNHFPAVVNYPYKTQPSEWGAGPPNAGFNQTAYPAPPPNFGQAPLQTLGQQQNYYAPIPSNYQSPGPSSASGILQPNHPPANYQQRVQESLRPSSASGMLQPNYPPANYQHRVQENLRMINQRTENNPTLKIKTETTHKKRRQAKPLTNAGATTEATEWPSQSMGQQQNYCMPPYNVYQLPGVAGPSFASGMSRSTCAPQNCNKQYYTESQCVINPINGIKTKLKLKEEPVAKKIKIIPKPLPNESPDQIPVFKTEKVNEYYVTEAEQQVSNVEVVVISSDDDDNEFDEQNDNI